MSQLQDRVKILSKRLDTLKVSANAMTTSMDKIDASISKAATLKPTLKGLESAYLDVIKVSQGLTVARPSTLKEIKAATANPSVDSVKKAQDAIEKHLAEIKKASGTDKRFSKFKSACDALNQKIEKIL